MKIDFLVIVRFLENCGYSRNFNSNFMIDLGLELFS